MGNWLERGVIYLALADTKNLHVESVKRMHELPDESLGCNGYGLNRLVGV